MPTDDLDARIRSLVGDAVAAAPAPPELDADGRPTAVAPVVTLGAGHSRRWLVPAAAALTAAAAVPGLVLVVSRDAPTTVPATDATEPTGVAVTTTVAPDSTVTTVIDTTVPDAATSTIAPATSAPPESTVTTMTTVVGPVEPDWVVTAGPDGVWVVGSDGATEQWWGLPAAVALESPDGSLIVQGRMGIGDGSSLGAWSPAETVPFIVRGPEVSATPPMSAELPEGWYRLHDVARLLDGRVMALVEWQTTVQEGLYTEPGRLYAVDVQSGSVVTVVDAFGGWEEGSSRLHLAENGVIVGEYSSSITRSWFTAVVPGGPPLATEAPGATAVGLEPFYDDCADCPQLYAIDRTGTVVAWLHGDDLVVHSLATSTERRVPLDGRGAGASDIDIELRVEGDLGGPLLVAVEHRWSYDERPAMVFEVGDAGITELPVGAPSSVSL